MCIFCKIVSSEIPSYKVYEDDFVLAFLDVAPVNYGHVLVIPKNHYANMEEVTNDDLCRVITVVKKIGQSLKENFNITGYNIQENNDPVAGQVVSHLHFHIIPRLENDGLLLWSGGRYGDDEIQEVLNKIKIK
ncbi:HIT family protein [Candidatus Parcubacteria bacterium]|nr:HIT family protein [Patescibacteria group bacterium]MBU4309133.1 HIT family protein [Patescibacteria group bacterium]MBU4432180.1 HIT family protein [Patescibacteria group bacterium]MBU4577494.1 HIT family protein [Patescibacteria group bacterium]MCG2697181.1 HIT family protein [Candidatus Parcubacteria bacterium]